MVGDPWPPTERTSSGCTRADTRPTSWRITGSRSVGPAWRRWSSNCSTGSKHRKISDAMRYLILTDVHANLEALETCLSDAKPRGYDQTLVLGDLVGYGADPNAVVERVRALRPAAIVRGTHAKVVLGLDSAEGVNAAARRATV